MGLVLVHAVGTADFYVKDNVNFLYESRTFVWFVKKLFLKALGGWRIDFLKGYFSILKNPNMFVVTLKKALF